MAETVSRRDFVKIGAGVGAGAVVAIGGERVFNLFQTDGGNQISPVVQKIEVTITDIMKEMVTHNPINEAKCYFWIYKVTVDGKDIPAECPGPTIVAKRGDTIEISITNRLDEAHSLTVPGMFDSGPISPGQTVQGSFVANNSGAFVYFDNLNAPVNRVMGLHGAILIMPTGPIPGHNQTPYDAPTPHVQAIYDAFGTPVFPGLKWEEGDNTTKVTAFRQFIWLHHQASSKLFTEVGNAAAGVDYNAQEFIAKFTKAEFKKNNSAISNDRGYTPDYFTINGQGGFFSHFSPTVTPQSRIGEPAVVHALNAGLWSHSLHIHANHVYVTSINGQVQTNPFWVDTWTLLPMHSFDYTVPFMRPPDIPNERGIGRADKGLNGKNTNKSVYPPLEEFEVFMPPKGTKAKGIHGDDVELAQRQSPLCYPMHDHSEPTQTAQGGNYPMGSLSGIYIVGDRNVMMDFPIDEDFQLMFRNIRGISKTGLAAGDPAAHTH